jgi:hypothetical protein
MLQVCAIVDRLGRARRRRAHLRALFGSIQPMMQQPSKTPDEHAGMHLRGSVATNGHGDYSTTGGYGHGDDDGGALMR